MDSRVCLYSITWSKTSVLLFTLFACAHTKHFTDGDQRIDERKNIPERNIFDLLKKGHQTLEQHRKARNVEAPNKHSAIEVLNEESHSRSIEEDIVNAANNLATHHLDNILKTDAIPWLDALPLNTKDLYVVSETDRALPSSTTLNLEELKHRSKERDADLAYHPVGHPYSDWGGRIKTEDLSVIFVPTEVVSAGVSESPQLTITVLGDNSPVTVNNNEKHVAYLHPEKPDEERKPIDESYFTSQIFGIKPTPTQPSQAETSAIPTPSSYLGVTSKKSWTWDTELKSSVVDPSSFLNDVTFATPSLSKSRESLSDSKANELTQVTDSSTGVTELNEQTNKLELNSTMVTVETKDANSNTIQIEPDDPNVLEPKDFGITSRVTATSTRTSYATTEAIHENEILPTDSLGDETTNIQATPKSSTKPSVFADPSGANETISVEDYTVLVNLTLKMSWAQFPVEADMIRVIVAELLNNQTVTRVRRDQIKLIDARKLSNELEVRRAGRAAETEITVYLFVYDSDYHYSKELTKDAGKYLIEKNSYYSGVLGNKILNASVFERAPADRVTQNAPSPLHNSGIIAGIAISIIAGLSLIALFISLLVFKHKMQPSQSMLAANLDAYTLDSFGDRGSTRRKKGRLSLRSFLNQAFDDPEMPSHPLSFSNLTSIINNKQSLEEEFKKLPAPLPLLEDVPAGAENKNRFANVIPNPETKVKLNPIPNVPNSDYINANYLKGYGGRSNVYIATQAPLKETLCDFWRMVWEQQTRTILMLTQLEENGTPRCAQYFPDNTHDCQRVYADFQVTLLSKDVRERFTLSTIRLLDLERNLFRDIAHLWFTAWPSNNVFDDPGALMNFILEMKNHIHGNAGPIVVHCSPGTGRTGAVIAVDILMKEYDESRIVDVQRCVTRIRQERHGAVNTLEQYILIHEVLHEYILKLGTQSQRPSLKSLMSLKLPSLS